MLSSSRRRAPKCHEVVKSACPTKWPRTQGPSRGPSPIQMTTVNSNISAKATPKMPKAAWWADRRTSWKVRSRYGQINRPAVNSGNDHNAFKSHGAAEVMGVSALRPNKVMDPTHTNAPSQGKTDLGKRDSKKAAPKNAPAATGASLWGTDKPSSPSKLFTKNTANNTWNAMVAEENHLASPSI